MGIAYNVATTGGNCKELASNLPAVGGVGGGDARAGLEAMLLLGQELLEGREQQKDVGWAAAVAHQADSPDFAFERTQAGADFDAEALEQSFADGRIVDTIRNPHGVELRQLVTFCVA